MLPVPLNSSKITSSMRDPVSTSAVARIERLPPPRMFRAAPRKRLGQCSALESRPPDSVRPVGGVTRLFARARRVIESSRIITCPPSSTMRRERS